jgi:hypothetical protein
MATLRVVLDTNVLLSGIAYPASVPGKILAAWRQRSIEVFLSTYILEELRRVLPRLSQRHGLNAAEIDTRSQLPDHWRQRPARPGRSLSHRHPSSFLVCACGHLTVGFD